MSATSHSLIASRQNRKRIGHDFCGSKLLHFKDSPYIPKRGLQRETAYGALGADELPAMLEATENAHEYLVLLRHLRQDGMTKLRSTLSTFGLWEKGSELPGPESLPALKHYIGDDRYPKFEALLISNRLDMIKGSLANKTDRFGNPSPDGFKYSAQIMLGQMPRQYWRAVIEHHLSGSISDCKGLESLWKPRLIPVETKAAYLFAARHYLGLRKTEIAQLSGLKATVIGCLENGINNPDAHDGKCLAAFYQHYSESLLGQAMEGTEILLPFFDHKCYDALPSGYHRQEVNASQRGAYRDRIMSETGRTVKARD